MKKDGIYTVNDLAKTTGYSSTTIRTYISTGRIRVRKVKCGKYKVNIASLKAILANKNIKRKCSECIYHKPLNGWGISQERGCWYLNITGKSRGCPVENCTKFKRRHKKREDVLS